jgi:UDP-N-acetylmuramyl pentapeptide phosphotransferase/UDP-N-acetylglucosamine-1-phosphate transferase
LVAAFAISAFVTWLSIRYARSRNLIDHPGQRRSHTQPTPRGGGIGIVVAVLLVFCAPLLVAGKATDAAIGVGIAVPLLLVAGVGWIDDHRPLSARVRILVHFAAVLLPFAAVFVWGMASGYRANPGDWLAGGIVMVLIVWSINLHNFMDGINGLLGLQAIFVFVALGLLCFRTPEAAAPMFVCAAATAGFLPFNFPPARTFMGDVGSGALGVMIAVAVLFAALSGAEFWPQRPTALSGVIACSAFVIDATCNLLSRMLRGRRWYSAHREHLYQWMTRAGMSHARVVGWYMGWNLFVVAPVLWWLNPEPPVGFDHGTGIFVERDELVAAIGAYALGIALWIFGKRWCLHRVESRRHA